MIYVIRHGKTELNKKNVLQGRSDHSLNDEGIEQAKQAAAKLKNISFDHVYSSPLVRAIQTAQIVTGCDDPVTDDRLIEMDYGPYEGADLKDPGPEIIYFFSDFVNNPAPDGMEQLSSVLERISEFIESIRGLKGNILISTHAIAMKGILEYLTPDSKGSFWARHIGNCDIYVIDNDGTWIGVPVKLT